MFIATTRFSIYQPKSNAWIVSKAASDPLSEKKYRDGLFDERRLDFRLGFLTNVTLPLLEKASKGHEFLHVIEYSSLLQPKYIEILNKIKAKYSFVRLNEYDENGVSKTNSTEIAVDYFKLKQLDRDALVASFILDDDDCISLDFFEKSKKYINKAFMGHAVSYGLGVYGVFDKDNKLVNVTQSYYPKVNIGLMRIGAYRHTHKKIVLPKAGSHTKFDRHMPTIIDSREVSYWWSKHTSQDTSNHDSYAKGYEGLKQAEHIDKSIIFNKFGEDILDNIKSIKDGFNI